MRCGPCSVYFHSRIVLSGKSSQWRREKEKNFLSSLLCGSTPCREQARKGKGVGVGVGQGNGLEKKSKT